MDTETKKPVALKVLANVPGAPKKKAPAPISTKVPAHFLENKPAKPAKPAAEDVDKAAAKPKKMVKHSEDKKSVVVVAKKPAPAKPKPVVVKHPKPKQPEPVEEEVQEQEEEQEEAETTAETQEMEVDEGEEQKPVEKKKTKKVHKEHKVKKHKAAEEEEEQEEEDEEEEHPHNHKEKKERKRRPKKVRDPTEPKRSRNAYFIFNAAMRKEVLEQYKCKDKDGKDVYMHEVKPGVNKKGKPLVDQEGNVITEPIMMPVTGTEITAELGARWRHLQASAKDEKDPDHAINKVLYEKFQAQAEAEKAQRAIEHAAWAAKKEAAAPPPVDDAVDRTAISPASPVEEEVQEQEDEEDTEMTEAQ